MTAFVPESIKVLGSDAGGASVVLCEMYVDTLADLPAPDTFTGFRLSMGCTATVINDNSRHRINSAGQWVQIAAGTSTYTRADIDTMLDTVNTELYNQQTQIDYAIKTGAKSMLPIGVSSITYYNAVTFSVADDGQITVNGTNPNTNNGIVYQDIVTAKTSQTETRYTLPVGRYKITETGTNGLRFQVHCHDGTNTYELHSSSRSGEFSYTESLKSQYPYICWRILIVAKSSFSNHVVKPMIWDAAITDSTFVPYAKTNRELTVLTDEDRAALVQQVDGGAKNMLPMTHADGSITRYGVTCTWDSNSGTMTLNGTHRSGDSTAIFEFYAGSADATTILPTGSYALTGCPAGGSTSTYRAILTQITGAVDIGTGVIFELSEPHYAAYRILISGNVTFNNEVFKPMICTASDYAISPAFVPYAPTNRQLYELIKQYHP